MSHPSGLIMRDSVAASISLVYLARLREAFGAASERIEAPPEVNTVGALRAWLARRGGAWAIELAPSRAVRIAVNHDLAQPDTPIHAGRRGRDFSAGDGG
jgi:molybdopterin synthase sulfur carrier subunit